MNWGKLPLIGFPIRDAIDRIWGPGRAQAIVRPSIRMWPSAFYSLAFLLLACGFLATGRVASARPAERREPAFAAGARTSA
jgi:hypothetical protein